MTNLLVGDHQVAVVNIDEGVIEGSYMSDPSRTPLSTSDMSGTHLNGFLVKNKI